MHMVMAVAGGTGSGSLAESVIQLLVLLAIFAVIVFLAYWSSRLTAKFSNKTMHGGNVEIIETVRVQNNKYIQIVRIADKYIAVGMGKDEFCFLTELSEDSVVRRDSNAASLDFKNIMNRFAQSENKSKGQDSHAVEEDKKEE